MIDPNGALIFLDFDGVLNHAGLVVVHGKSGKKFDRTCCEMVIKLAEVGAAKVVISSSWRQDRTIEELRSMIARQGDCDVPADLIVGATPLGLGTRGVQVENWRAAHGHVGRYVIIDDFNDFLPWQKPHFVRTCALRGFGYLEFLEALLILAPTSPLLRDAHRQIDSANSAGLDWDAA